MSKYRTLWISGSALLALSACAEDARCPDGRSRIGSLCVATTMDSGVKAADGDGGRLGQLDGGTSPGAMGEAPECPAYVDADGDGLGAGERVLVFGLSGDCEQLPIGYADNDDDLQDCQQAPAPLFEDEDGDGFGAAATDKSACPGGPAPAGFSFKSGDCDDSPEACGKDCSPDQLEICDGQDNNCDNATDELLTNDCGGACTAPFPQGQAPGMPCSNNLQGACRREGTFECSGPTTTQCSAANVAPGAELCGDDIDNDCDGLSDEPDATNAPTWYKDCDGDGFSPATDGSVRACEKPAAAAGCGWTAIMPNMAVPPTAWDCDDTRASIHPNASFGPAPAGTTRRDLNCDLVLEPDPTWNASSMLPVCAPAVLAYINQNGLRSNCGIDWQTCYAWMNNSGAFVSTPLGGQTPVCPDTVFAISMNSQGECIANQSTRGLWPCR